MSAVAERIASGTLTSRVPWAEYAAVDAISITRLKELRRSPLHYQYLLANTKQSGALTLGTATHTATLEPERFSRDFAIWDRRTDSGRMAPRNGKAWDQFVTGNAGKIILTADEADIAKAIANAVRCDEKANRYLAAGEPEVSMQWIHGTHPCKGRVDWFTCEGKDVVLVGLKTTRDCRHLIFGSQAAKLGYHLQWSFYLDGYQAISGIRPRMVEIVVESAPPHAVAVYNIPNDIIEQGREEYLRLIDLLERCEQSGEWAGPQLHEEDLTLPTWAYEREDEDLSDLELEAIA